MIIASDLWFAPTGSCLVFTNGNTAVVAPSRVTTAEAEFFLFFHPIYYLSPACPAPSSS